MIYGCQVWGQGNESHIEKIFILQKRALRIINFNEFRAHTNPLYKDDKIVKLQDFIKLQNCLFIYDYLNASLPDCFEDYYFRLNSMYFNVKTRNSNLGCLFSPSKKNYEVWNTQKSISRHKLKTTLTIQFLNQY